MNRRKSYVREGRKDEVHGEFYNRRSRNGFRDREINWFWMRKTWDFKVNDLCQF